MTMFIDPNNGNNLIFAIIGFVVAILGSFIITLIIWKENTNRAEPSIEGVVEEELIEEEKEVNILVSPVEGKVIDLGKVNDELFASKTLGDGVAIIPTNGNLYAPCDSEVVMLFETKHAIGLRTNGAEILIHIGINTVSMNGDGFKTFVKTGDNVKEGDLLIQFDLDKISNANLDSTVMIVNNNGSEYAYKVLNQSYGNVEKEVSCLM